MWTIPYIISQFLYPALTLPKFMVLADNYIAKENVNLRRQVYFSFLHFTGNCFFFTNQRFEATLHCQMMISIFYQLSIFKMGEETATHSIILAGEIPWTEGPGGLQSMGSQRVEHNLMIKQCNIFKLRYVSIFKS